jgi:uncharacterized protein (TIGR03000 family)
MSFPRAVAVGSAVLLVVTVPVGPVHAQAAVGVGVGAGTGPWYGPGVGTGVYMNGAPLGQPGPALPAVPGTFIGGLGTERLYYGNRVGTYDPWIFSPGLGVYGPGKDFPPIVPPAGWDGPLFATRDVRQYYAWAKTNPDAAYARAFGEFARVDPRLYRRVYGPQLLQPCLRVLVRVPTADCAVTIQNQPMSSTGTDRMFESPPLTPGTEYKYTIGAKLPDGRTETKTVVGKAGDTVVVEFGPAGSPPPRMPIPERPQPPATSSSPPATLPNR